MLLTTVLLALAWFTTLNASATLVSWLMGAVLHRSPIRGRPGLFLGIRLFPAATSLLITLVFFVPAHWMSERRDLNESFGWVLYLLAAAGAGLILRSAMQALALARADRRLRARERCSARFPHVREADGVPGLALAGLVRTRILMGPQVAASLTTAELEVAMAHELAHRRAVDNLKRWALHCAPDFFGCSRTARQTERAWHAAAESVADARAVGGDPKRALDLASALVKVARLTVGKPPARLTLVWSPFNDPLLLEERVHRLTSETPLAVIPCRPARLAVVVGVLLAGTVLLVPLLSGPIHNLTEAAVAFLP